MNEKGIPARRSAIWLLDQVLGQGKLLSELIATGGLDRLAAEDRARAQRLATDVLRHLSRCDKLIDRHVQKSPQPHVRNVLRLGALELAQGAAAHGVVNDLVTIISRDNRHGRLRGLVNAVLRKIAAEAPEVWPILAPPKLPKWLRSPLVQAWGAPAVKAMEVAQAAGAPVDLTVRVATDEVAAALNGTVLPTGSIRLADAGQISALPGYSDGAWWVQDAAAALPARILAPAIGAKVLDLCSAPGGKTLQLAAMGAEVTSVDISEGRVQRLRENLARTGLAADVQVQDALTLQGQWDAILLDAPCSATGTMRRHPDLPHAKDGSEFGALIALQSELIDHAWTLLKPGGRMVFCTCSLLPDEGEVQVEDALARHKDMQIDTEALRIPGVDAEWITPEGGLRLRPDYWPEHGGMDGFFIGVLHKLA